MLKFTITEETKIWLAEDEWPGVIRVAGYVAADTEAVCGIRPGISVLDKDDSGSATVTAAMLRPDHIYPATAGHGSLLDSLAGSGMIDLSAIEGKREVYLFKTVKAGDGEGASLVIAGSDKRGTIYGLFHLSELMGVSPWVWFADVAPAHRDSVVLTAEDEYISREPSVKYRGIFINDEWPSFGNWTFEHFGGFTAEMYEHVFELLLRLRANYLWPAMWSSNFSLDGPGLESARLADEMGIVMSNSHHEPCLRHSEEWDLVKGEDTPFGTEWNFDRNREGLLNYWREGLKRNGDFENIITMGMRGERDSEILGHEATLKENIDYLKDVVTAQNELIRETIDPELKLPRMIAIYKEVEEYYYGDADNSGLREWDGLDGITCMLCEDNFGNMRRLPEPGEKDRNGGFGMYYHFDYHGGPVSYEWVNSTHLSKVWEQMTLCYESGVREIWIVNVGDLKPQELPVSFFLDMAYDYDKWGISNRDSDMEYLHKWAIDQFGQKQSGMIITLLNEYTRINSVRKPESLQSDTYHPFNFGESEFMAGLARTLIAKAVETEKEFADTPLYDAYQQLVGFPVRASMNVLLMQLAAGRNRMLAAQGRTSANVYADLIAEYIEEDARLTQMYHSLSGGKWNGLMLSKHIGFKNWNDEECAYPLRTYVTPSRRKCMVVAESDGEGCTFGGDWTRRPVRIRGFMNPGVTVKEFVIENAGTESFGWRIECDDEWIVLPTRNGELSPRESFTPQIILDPVRLSDRIEKDRTVVSVIRVSSDFAHADVRVPCTAFDSAERKIRHYIPVNGVKDDPGFISRDHYSYTGADELSLIVDAHEFEPSGGYEIMYGYGKYGSGLRPYPVTAGFAPVNSGSYADTDSASFGDTGIPTASCEVYAPAAGDYSLTLITSPSNSIDGSGHLRVGVRVNDADMICMDTIGEGFVGGSTGSSGWCRGVLDNEHTVTSTVNLTQGTNRISLFAVDPAVIPERIIIGFKD